MPFLSVRSMISAGLVLVAAGLASLSQAAGPRKSALERYGIGGHIQAIGLHHGFHIETVAIDSDAFADQLRQHDIIVKVDGDVIRNLDHLRAVLAEAYLGDGEVTLTYTRGESLIHHVVKSHLKREDARRVGRKPRPEDDTDGTR